MTLNSMRVFAIALAVPADCPSPSIWARTIAPSIKSEPAKIGGTPLTVSNDKIFAVPTFYIETVEDKVISIQSQRRYQERIPGIKVFSMKTGHCPFLSKPSEVAGYLLKTDL